MINSFGKGGEILEVGLIATLSYTFRLVFLCRRRDLLNNFTIKNYDKVKSLKSLPSWLKVQKDNDVSMFTYHHYQVNNE